VIVAAYRWSAAMVSVRAAHRETHGALSKTPGLALYARERPAVVDYEIRARFLSEGEVELVTAAL
jgi:hypothetical protein